MASVTPRRNKDEPRDVVADYTTIGLAIGLSWKEARRIAQEIQADKEANDG